MNEIVKDYYLSHHGILGQKWGKRNGPPYPLGVSDHSASEKKAGWRKSLDSKKRDTYAKQYGKNRVGGLEDIDPSILTTAVSFISIPLIMNGKFAVERALKRAAEKGYNKNIHSENDVPKKKTKGTMESDRAAVNPKFQDIQTDNGYIRNCMYCSTVYDLRRRGYDVTANKRSAGGNSKQVTTWYKNSKLEKYKDKEQAFNALQSQPEGARGNLMGFGLYGAHSIAYEIKNGKVELIDAQTNESWSWKDFTNRFSKSYHIVRTDNCEVNWEKIGETIDPDSLRKG